MSKWQSVIKAYGEWFVDRNSGVEENDQFSPPIFAHLKRIQVFEEEVVAEF